MNYKRLHILSLLIGLLSTLVINNVALANTGMKESAFSKWMEVSKKGHGNENGAMENNNAKMKGEKMGKMKKMKKMNKNNMGNTEEMDEMNALDFTDMDDMKKMKIEKNDTMKKASNMNMVKGKSMDEDSMKTEMKTEMTSKMNRKKMRKKMDQKMKTEMKTEQ